MVWTYNVLDVVAHSTGDIYIILGEYPKYQLPIDHYYPTGWVCAADDLRQRTIIDLYPEAVVYFQSIDEEEINPDGYTLGKGNPISFEKYQPVPNNYIPCSPFESCTWKKP